MFRTSFTPRKELWQGAQLRFVRVAGKAQVWVDGILLARKTSFAPLQWRVPLPPGKGERSITVIIERDAGMAAGMDDVIVEADSGVSVDVSAMKGR